MSNREFFTSVQTDVGKQRSNNEDNFLFKTLSNVNSENEFRAQVVEMPDSWMCYAVFDGMGGLEHGEIASKIMSEECFEQLAGLTGEYSYTEIDNKVKDAIASANAKIVEISRECGICGTTATILMTDGVVYKIYHLGDSRAYLYREEQLHQLTEDHTVAELKKKAGFEDDQITEKEHHQLTEFVGADRKCAGMRPQESAWKGLKKGDKIILCSDGLYDMVEDLLPIIKGTPDEELVENMVNKALEIGRAHV